MWEKINLSSLGGINLLIFALIGLAGLGVGRLWQVNQARAQVTIAEAVVASSTISNISAPVTGKSSGKYVGSKTGNKYHLPTCGGAKRIKEENKVWFASKEAAEKAGYFPAGNCKGI